MVGAKIMRYFKNTNNEFFGIDTDQENLIQPDWIEITKEDIDEANSPKQDQINQSRIYELQMKLANTDYKDLPSYDKRNTEEWNNLMLDRQSWRDEIRSLGG
jgi:hypothetical protein